MRTFALLFAVVALASALELVTFKEAVGEQRNVRDAESQTFVRVCHVAASSTVINVKTSTMSNTTNGIGFGQCTIIQGLDTSMTGVVLAVTNAADGTALATYPIVGFSTQATQNLFLVTLVGTTWAVTAPRGTGLIPTGFTRVLLVNAAADNLVVDFYSRAVDADTDTWTLLYGPTLQNGVSFLDIPATNQGANDIQVRDHSTGTVYTQKREFMDDNTWLADTEVLIAFCGQNNGAVALQLFSNPDVSGAAAIVASWAVIALALLALLL